MLMGKFVGRWLFAAGLAVSALVFSGSAQAQGAGYFEVLPPAGASLDPALAARWAKGLPAKAPDAARDAVFAGMRCLAGSGSL